LASDLAGFQRYRVLAILEALCDFVKHWVHPFIFTDRVSGAVVHLTTGGHCQPTAQLSGYRHLQNKQALKTRNARIS
jgi:hypothetical protein